jgi:hypothetical protein
MKYLMPSLLLLLAATVAVAQPAPPAGRRAVARGPTVPSVKPDLRYVLVYRVVVSHGVTLSEGGVRTQVFAYEQRVFAFRELSELASVGAQLAQEQVPEGAVLVGADGTLGPVAPACTRERVVALYDLQSARKLEVEFGAAEELVPHVRRTMNVR